MRLRAFSTVLPMTVLLTVLLTVLSLAGPARIAGASGTVEPVGASSVRAAATSTDDGDDTTRPTVNEFFPEERPLSDCLSSLPKPNCGSEARGGWAQTTVFLVMMAGLAFIAWRIVAGARKGRRPPVSPGTPDATTAPDGDGGVPAP